MDVEAVASLKLLILWIKTRYINEENNIEQVRVFRDAYKIIKSTGY
jgi:hypothetical protein